MGGLRVVLPCVGAAAMLWVSEGLAAAEGLVPNVQMGVSRDIPTNGIDYQHWTVWASRADGKLVSMREVPGGPEIPLWENRGNPQNASPGAQGVSAVGWGTTVAYERAYFVDTPNNRFVEYALQDGVPVGTAIVPAPAGKTLTGYFAASVRWNGVAGDYTMCLFATAKDAAGDTSARLYAGEWDPDVPIGNVNWALLTPSSVKVRADAPLATTRTGDDRYPRVFAVTVAGSLPTVDDAIFTARFDSGGGGGWQWNYLGRPPGNLAVGGVLASTEGDLASKGYKTYLYCTRRGAATTSVFVAGATGVGSRTFAWDAAPKSTAGFGDAPSSGYAMAATSRGATGGNQIDLYVLTSSSTLLHLKQAPGGNMGTFADLGADGESTTRQGGLVATPVQPAGYSHVFFLGPLAATGRLYRRVGEESYPASNPWYWANHQAGNGRVTLASNNHLTENSTALLKGKAVNVAMVANGATEYQVQLRWSMDDGSGWGAPITMPRESTETAAEPPGNQGASRNTQVGDPTVALDDNGTAWVSLFGIDRRTDNDPLTHDEPYSCSGQDRIDNEIFFTTVTQAGVVAPATRILKLPAITDSSGQDWSAVDHPWIAVDRLGVDRVHVTWMMRYLDAGGQVATLIHYTQSTTGNFAPNIRTLNMSGGATRVLVGAQHAIYVLTGAEICRINAAFTDCEDTRTFEPDEESDGLPNGKLDVVNSSNPLAFVPIGGEWSAVASPTDPNLVYRAFQRLEADGAHLDVWVERIIYDPVLHEFTLFAHDAVHLAAVHDEGHTQAYPELTVSRDTTFTEIVFGSWYDWRDGGAGACAQGNPAADACYRVKTSLSFNQATSDFGWESTLHIGASNPLSDPDLLPWRCGAGANERFLGDFHAVTGDLLHSFHVVVGAPAGGAAMTGDLFRGWESGGFSYW